MSFVTKDINLQAFESHIISSRQLFKVVPHIRFAFDTSKKIKHVHCMGNPVTLVPGLPRETVGCRLSVCGFRSGASRFFALLLWACVAVVLWRQAELADVNSSAVATTSPILTVVGVANLPPVRRRGVHKARFGICPKSPFSRFVLSSSLWSGPLLVVGGVSAFPFSIASPFFC